MKFRKKPIVVEAFHMTNEHIMDDSLWPEWLKKAILFEQVPISFGGWIIRGGNGKLYTCTNDVFESTYEAVETTSIETAGNIPAINPKEIQYAVECGYQAVVGEKLMLVVKELGDAIDGFRQGLHDKNLSRRPMFEVKLADAVLRLFDLAGALEINLGNIMVEKMAYNREKNNESEARDEV